MDLKGKVGIVTGAARGIGRATAIALAEAGAKAVVLADLKEQELTESADAVRDAGAEPLVISTGRGQRGVPSTSSSSKPNPASGSWTFFTTMPGLVRGRRTGPGSRRNESPRSWISISAP